MRRTMSNRTTVLWVGVTAILLVGLVTVVSQLIGDGVGDPDVPVSMERLGSLPSDLDEASGIATSRVHPGVLWTHNDGADGRLFALGLDGTPRGAVSIEGVGAVDWEDVAAGPCPADRDPCLYIADTGDNRAERDDVAIVVVREPPEIADGGTVRPLAVVRLRYADGPVDVEALAISPEDDAILISKGEDGSARLYRLEGHRLAAGAEGDGPAVPGAAAAATAPTLSAEAILPLDVSSRERRVTGASFSPDGAILAVRTLTAVYLFANGEWNRVAGFCPLGRSEPQGEAVDFLDDGRLVVTGEAAVVGPAPIYALWCEETPGTGGGSDERAP